MVIQNQSVIARFFDLLDGAAEGDPVDVLSEDFQFELVFPGVGGPPDERISGGKEEFRQFMAGLDARGRDRHSADSERRHYIRTLTCVDGLELMVGKAVGGRRQGTLLAAAQENHEGKLRRFVVVMTSVSFPELHD